MPRRFELSAPLVGLIDAMPALGRVRALHHFRFRRRPGLFCGIHRTQADANAALSIDLPSGYDHPAAASMYADHHYRIHPCDYAVLWHLQKHLAAGDRLLDFGGHLGIKYYSFRDYLEYPEGLLWTVCDTAAVCEAGSTLARERGASDLQFATTPAQAGSADIWMANGSLQYVADTLTQLLSASGPSLPRLVLLNKTALHMNEAFWTVQNIGTAYCAYHVRHRSELEGELASLGYTIVDRWLTPELGCQIPHAPQFSVPAYSGLAAVLRP